MHVAALIQIQPIAYHDYSPLQIVCVKESNISYMQIFKCAVYVPILPLRHTSMGPQRNLGVYIGYEFVTPKNFYGYKLGKIIMIGIFIGIS